MVANNLDRRCQEAAKTAPAGDVRDSNLPLATLEIEKLRIRASTAWRDELYEAAQDASSTACEAALKRLAQGELPYRGQTGAETVEGFLERAYICRSDNSPQPYYVRLPKNYDPARPWPLVVLLHGYVPETSKINPWLVPVSQAQLATDRGMILVMPHGRRNSDFLGIGEVDVLRVIAEMRRFYTIDPNRINMAGCSMGGYGGWAIALRHPGEFAALTPMSGQTDFFLWEKRKREDVRYKSWCVEQNNPLDLAVNARYLPMLVQHGELDNLVPTEHSRIMVGELGRLHYDVRYEEYKGQGHYIYWTDPPFEKLFEFLKDKVRATPTEVVYKTFTPKQGRAYWVDIRRLTQWGEAGEITAKIADGKLDVTAKNLSEVWLDPPAAARGAGAVQVSVNGQVAGTLAVGANKLTLEAGGAKLAAGTPPVERPRVGPAREVFNRPFLVVQATGGDAARQTLNATRAGQFGPLWWAFAEGLPTVLRDVDLTAEQVRSHNLVIFGEPETVKLPGIAEPAAMLPKGVSMAAGKYALGRHAFTGDKVGMYALAAHPLDPQGLILWCSGVEYGRGLPPNHQFDLLPDVLIYNDQLDWDGTNKYLAGGFVSPDFVLDEARLDVAAP